MILNEKQEELSLAIQKILRDKVSDNKLNKAIANDLKKRVYNAKIVDVQNTRNKKDNAIIFSVEELYWITKFMLNNESQFNFNLKIDIEKYFSYIEIKDAELYLIKEEEDEDFIVIHNVNRVPDGSFSCSGISIKELARWWRHGTLKYNPETQREASVLITNIGEVGWVTKPTIYPENVLQIKEAILKNKFLPNTLTCNILKTGEESFEYNSEEHILTLYGVCKNLTFFDLIDGAHRVEGGSQATEKDKNIDAYFQLKIWNVDVAKAQLFVSQESRGRKMSEERTVSFEQTKYSTIINDVNEYGDSETNSMKMKITDVIMQVMAREKYCMFSTLISNLKDKWDDVLVKPADNGKVTKYLVEFFNELTGFLYEDFSNFKKKKSIATMENMFTFYIYLGRKLYKKDNWRDLLEMFIKDIDFSDNNEIWKELQIKAPTQKPSIKTKIYNYIDNKFTSYDEVI